MLTLAGKATTSLSCRRGEGLALVHAAPAVRGVTLISFPLKRGLVVPVPTFGRKI